MQYIFKVITQDKQNVLKEYFVEANNFTTAIQIIWNLKNPHLKDKLYLLSEIKEEVIEVKQLGELIRDTEIKN